MYFWKSVLNFSDKKHKYFYQYSSNISPALSLS